MSINLGFTCYPRHLIGDPLSRPKVRAFRKEKCLFSWLPLLTVVASDILMGGFQTVLSSSPAVDHELVREAARPSGARPVKCTHILLAMRMQALTHAWTLHLGRRTPHDRIPLTSPLIRPFDRKLLCCCARTPHVQWDAWDPEG